LFGGAFAFSGWNLDDIELTLRVLAEYHLANKVDVVRDGAEALDYLYRRARFAAGSRRCGSGRGTTRPSCAASRR